MKKFAKLLFRLRSYTPLPFIIIMLIYYNGNTMSWIIGFIILMSGELLRLWGVIYVGSLTRTTSKVKANQLVASGPFAHVRNPLYIGNILIYLGVGVISFALFPYLQLVALAWFIFQYILIIGIEEEFLINKFGVQFSEYKEKVPRFIPRLVPQLFNNDFIVEPNIRKGIKSEIRTIQAILSVLILAIIIHLVR